MALSLVKMVRHKDAAASAARVLLLDTPENLGVDFLQSLQHLQIKLVFERVNTKEELYTALRKGGWDILLASDQVNVPSLDETLAYLNQLGGDTRCVLLSKSALSIDELTNAYRKGLAAVVSTRHPEYSQEVFAREAERSRRDYQLRLLNQEKFELKRHCQQLMSGTEEALAYLQDGIHVFGNDAYLALLGYGDMDELIVMPFIDIVAPDMRERIKQRLLDFQHKVRLQPDTDDLEIPALVLQGGADNDRPVRVAARFRPVTYDGESCIQVQFRAAEDTRQPPTSVQEPAPPAAAEPVPPGMDTSGITAALNANKLRLSSETVISVTDLVAEFHDVRVCLPGERTVLDTVALGAVPLAGKLDQWALQQSLAVVSELYAKGQEYPVLLRLSARSLADKRLADGIRGQLQARALPGAMLAVDFARADVEADPGNAKAQFERLKAEGVTLCLSGIRGQEDVRQVTGGARIDLVRLDAATLQDAMRGEDGFERLRLVVESWHAAKAKVLAGSVDGQQALTICCNAGVDFVEGACIQDEPQPYEAAVLAKTLMI